MEALGEIDIPLNLAPSKLVVSVAPSKLTILLRPLFPVLWECLENHKSCTPPQNYVS
jgi:hypothetical protein